MFIVQCTYMLCISPSLLYAYVVIVYILFRIKWITIHNELIYTYTYTYNMFIVHEHVCSYNIHLIFNCNP